MSVSGDLWYVKLSDGDVHRVTLDQLDEAFQAGQIDGETMVLAAGETQWSKLGDLAGIDDDAPIEAEAVDDAWADDTPRTAQPAPVQPASFAPSPPSSGPPNVQAAPASNASAWALSPSIASPRVQPLPQAVPVPAYGAPFPYMSPSAVPPFAAPTSRQAPSTAPAFARGTPVPNSLRPLSVDFGELDDDARSLRGRSGKRWFGVLVGLAAIGGVATVALQRPSWAQPVLSRIGLHGAQTAAAVGAPEVAPPPPPPTPAPPPPVVAPEPPAVAPVNAALSGDSPMNPHFTNQTNETDVKAHNPEAKPAHARKGGHGGAAGHSAAPKGKSTVFTTGGNKYDPLNSSI